MASANDARFANPAEVAAALNQVSCLADTGVATAGHRRYGDGPGGNRRPGGGHSFAAVREVAEVSARA